LDIGMNLGKIKAGTCPSAEKGFWTSGALSPRGEGASQEFGPGSCIHSCRE
jgi:hypothetical protein